MMTTTSRREFLIRSSAYTVAMAALSRWRLGGEASAAPNLGEPSPKYGPLIPDPHELLDLPKGFSYQIISRSGDRMDDGYFVPGKPDGMGTFAGPDGYTLLIRNHELRPDEWPGPFGKENCDLRPADKAKLYDLGGGRTVHHGGTTTILYDTKRQRVVREFLSLAGTSRNCAGGPTPWNSWISCEETVDRVGRGLHGDYHSDKDHGYNFETPASAAIGLAEPTPLIGMGRFNHEAVAVDPPTSIVYETEDREDGLIYRFLPNKPGKLAEGGKLQALGLKDLKSADTRHWRGDGVVEVGHRRPVRWHDLDDVQSPEDDLRHRGFDAGAAKFARGEGMWYSDNYIYFACTNGGRKKKGQIWRLALDGKRDGELELFIEPNNSSLLENADNMTVAPWGDLVVCEDRDDPVVRLVGVTPSGELYTLANSHARSEFAGVAFSPDGSTLFVNIQHRGLTLAINGPW